MKINGIVLTDALADGTFPFFKVKAFIMDIGDQGNCLGKINMHRFIRRKVLIVGIGDFNRAILDTDGTTRAIVLDDVSGLFRQGDLEISRFPPDAVNFSIGQYLDIWMPADLDQFG
jgi:hypothetical protein